MFQDFEIKVKGYGSILIFNASPARRRIYSNFVDDHCLRFNGGVVALKEGGGGGYEMVKKIQQKMKVWSNGGGGAVEQASSGGRVVKWWSSGGAGVEERWWSGGGDRPVKYSFVLFICTPTEMQLRREKGLCFTCDDKFTWNHKCPNKQALILMTTSDDSDFTSLIETSEEQVNVTPVSQEIIEPHLSLNAYHGSNGVVTIRLSGSINGTKVQVLLDGGSSDNFIQPQVAKHVRLPIEPTETFRVIVESGTFLQVEGLISSILLYVQNELIQFPAYVLPISGAYIILGAAWLATLGPHIADYSSATVKFYLDDKFITLTGDMSLPPSQA
nr:Ty3/gypsy retrotransposon protein [Tanacetum cinerariifolium]